MSQLKQTIGGRKIKSYIPQFSGDSVEMLLYIISRFLDTMETKAINANNWHDQFGYTLHGEPSSLWDNVLADRDKNGAQFDANKVGFNLSIKFYVKKYVADPYARDTQFQALNTGSFLFIIAVGGGGGKSISDRFGHSIDTYPSDKLFREG